MKKEMTGKKGKDRIWKEQARQTIGRWNKGRESIERKGRRANEGKGKNNEGKGREEKERGDQTPPPKQKLQRIAKGE